jgi:arylsulfatase A-like enzyme
MEDDWELFDLAEDPSEVNNVYADPAYSGVLIDMKQKLSELQQAYGDTEIPVENEY